MINNFYFYKCLIIIKYPHLFPLLQILRPLPHAYFIDLQYFMACFKSNSSVAALKPKA
jgi:hypothetical protein